MTATVPVLEVTGLCKRFGSFTAVDEVSFALAPGGSVGIVGESGSGKTTTARILVGLERASAGQVLLDGEVIAAPSRRARQAQARTLARKIQMIFQDPYQSFDSRLTIEESIAEPLRLHFGLNGEGRRRRVAELCDQVGLSSRQAQALPRNLSGGQRQRAAIARALGIEPTVLVLDEAVAALDVSIQAQVLRLLADIRRDTGISYVFVSHDLAVIRAITDDAIVMRSGRIVEEGPTERLLTAPQHPYTQLLLASVPEPGWDPAAVARAGRELEPTGSSSQGARTP
ncbi:ATP-binding cassette domain-containing protein [Blastococcus sp. BMG 814]|uniref:ATP-binding cassette domain-containing protein n=1 Tax=Blastococcus carthaginiensis TaxID=3050034 RepID=A0ABT9IER0_9ACTN|nr:ATP-binding cassette domain-containing protein [Blastococcus carthaginiensis]MDP5183624.1 ATP-binding cassette domain-containing protein [Blastococcus carthaginiensis]